MRGSDQPTICVGGLVDPELPFARETMHALPDPASPFQAVLQNVPFFVDGLNFGDLVRIGAPDEAGVHPIEAVVATSGHVRFLLFHEDEPQDDDLLVHMGELFAEHELRMEMGVDGLIAMSMHPGLAPVEVAEALFDWFAGRVPEDESMWDRTAFEIVGPIESVVGPMCPDFRNPDEPFGRLPTNR